MKKSLFILVITFGFLTCKAQHIIPIEEVVNYHDDENGVMGDKDYVYVKDVNNVLGKYIGDWAGSQNGKSYFFRISKITTDDGELKIDKLLMRYTITESNGTVIENTLNLPDSKVRTGGGYMDKTVYVFNYHGENSSCGRNGTIFTEVRQVNGAAVLRLFLVEGGELWDCDTPVPQTMPTEPIMAAKQ